MVTMPGLPMFGHGQIEGLTEKYGMEYRRAYWDEQVDEEMVRRHEVEIFPLMRRRRLFSGAANFAFFDFVTTEGHVDENVFAYSNRAEGERAVILYNNSYHRTRGRIHLSTPINVGPDDETTLVQRSLVEALALNMAANRYYAYRDHRTGLQYLRAGQDMAVHGLYTELDGYQYHAFLDFEEIQDPDGHWRELAEWLDGRGVPDLATARKELDLRPVLVPYQRLLRPEILTGLEEVCDETLATLQASWNDWLAAIKAHSQQESPRSGGEADLWKDLTVALRLESLATKTDMEGAVTAALATLLENEGLLAWRQIALARASINSLCCLESTTDAEDAPANCLARAEDWLLPQHLREAFQARDGDPSRAHYDMLLTLITVAHPGACAPPSERSLAETWRDLLREPLVQEYLQVNQYDGALWLNRERLERMVKVLGLTAVTDFAAADELNAKSLSRIVDNGRLVLESAQAAGYRVRETVQHLTA
jgi:hypothetical protein